MGETSVKAASGRSSPEVLAAQAAQAALRNLRRICQDPDQRAQDRIAAAKVLLEYGGIKPADEDDSLTVRVEGAPGDWLK